jgi:hypothetical protein
MMTATMAEVRHITAVVMAAGPVANRVNRNTYNKVNNVHVNVDKSARRNNVNRVNRQARVNNNVGNRQGRAQRQANRGDRRHR